jgi:TRAP-type mannitol/chloroaromatic compound transport system permease small subunit
VRCVDRVNRIVGRAAMYLVFVIMGLLLFSALDRLAIGTFPLWVVEMAEFLMAGYYFLGGAYALQLDGHVRMDLLYGRMTPRRRALVDVLTVATLLFYLVVLLLGGISSTEYALTTDQRNFSAWGPPLAPIKAVMTVGIALMLLQVTAVLFRDLALASGRTLE